MIVNYDRKTSSGKHPSFEPFYREPFYTVPCQRINYDRKSFTAASPIIKDLLTQQDLVSK